MADLCTLLTLIYAVATILVYIKKPPSGAILFLMGVLLLPYINLSAISFRIEYPLIPVFMAITLAKPLKYSNSKIEYTDVATVFFIWWLFLLATTLVSVLTLKAAAVDWLGLYAFTKPVLLLIIFYNVPFSTKNLAQALLWFCYSAIPLVLMGLGQTFGIEFIRNLSIVAYTSQARAVLENQLLSETQGFIFRSVSIFENVSYVALYYLLVIGTAITILSRKSVPLTKCEDYLLKTSILITLIGGMFTFSATFNAGMLFLVLWILYICNRKNRIRLMYVIGLFLVALISFVGPLLYKYDYNQYYYPLVFQIERLLDFSLFETRYDSGSGVLVEAIGAIIERPMIGWGVNSNNDVFFSDSLYVFLMYYGGVVGTLFFVAPVLAISWLTIYKKTLIENIVLLWLLLFIIAGLGSPSFFIPRLADWCWSIVGMYLRIRKSEQRAQSVE